jgi:hypothetical protein
MFCVVLPSTAQNQPSMTDSVYVRRLENVYKVLGYLKYFHSGLNSNIAGMIALCKQ